MVGLRDMIDIVKLLIILKKTLFGWNIMGGTKPERFGRYLAKNYETDRNLNWDKNDVILSLFLTDTKHYDHFGRNGTNRQLWTQHMDKDGLFNRRVRIL